MWIHSYRPLGDHCELKHIRRCPRRPSQPDFPQGRRRARQAPLPEARLVLSAGPLHVVSARAAAPRPSAGAIVRHWRHRQPPPERGVPDCALARCRVHPRRPMSARHAEAGCQTQASDSPALSHRLPPVSISARARGARLRTCALSRRTRVGQCPRAATAARARPAPSAFISRPHPASACESHSKS